MTVQFPHLDYLNLFNWVWSTSAKASILIVLLLIIKFAFKNKIGARLHYLLWSVVIISLILPWTPQSSLSLYNLINPGTQQTSVIVGDEENSLISNNMVNGISSEVVANSPEPITSSQSQSLLPNLKELVAVSSFIHKLLFFIWIVGIVSFITITIGVNRRFALRIQGQPVVDMKLLTAFEKAKENLNVKKEIPLIQTEHVTSPSLYGLFHPQLLIPVGILEGFNSEQLTHVFLHELLHFKRKDLWVNWITQGLLFLHWFNPLVWYAFLRLREDQEMACDSVALEHLGTNNAKNYAYTLITLLEKNSNSSRITSLASLLGTQSQVGRRIAMIKGFHKTPMKWSFLVIGVVVALAFVTLSNAKANTSITDGTMTSVANNTLESNFRTVKIESNKLVSNEGWSLSIDKVINLGSTNGYGWHSPFRETDTFRSYSIFFTIENAEGKDKAFLPKGKVLGIVGTSGKFYEFLNGEYPSLDKLYSDKHWETIDNPNSPEHWDSMGKPNSPGVFKLGTHANVDLNEQGIIKVVYQDENGTKYEIPFQGTITVLPNPNDTTSKKVAKLYGESNPKILKVNRILVESKDVSGYKVVLEGNFSKDGKKASTLEFSMLADGTKVWALRGYNEGEGKDIWLDNEVSI
jgi:beta-lactamase regulating signal transducer with metallopeptidase domain